MENRAQLRRTRFAEVVFVAELISALLLERVYTIKIARFNSGAILSKELV